MFRSFRALLLLSLPVTFAAIACSGNGVTIGEFDASTTNDGGTTTPSDGGAGTDAPIVGPKVSIYVRATAATFPHSDGLSSMNPTDARLWIRNLSLDFANGPTGVKIFELTEAKETPINDKSETLIAEVPIAKLPTGTAVKAHVATDKVSYQVPTKLHFANMVVDGEIKGTQALSDNAVMTNSQGQTGIFPPGFYSVGFIYNNQVISASDGTDAPLPTGPVGGGFELAKVNGVAYYSFPIVLPVSNGVTTDRKMYITLNVDHNFRWVDSKKAGYVGGAWDTEPPNFEEVVRFGANSFALTLE